MGGCRPRSGATERSTTRPERVMAPLLAWLIAARLAQGAPGPAAIRVLAERPRDAGLVAAVRSRPDDARLALGQLLSRTAGATTDSLRDASLSAALRLAGSYAVAWSDSFLLHRVELFA